MPEPPGEHSQSAALAALNVDEVLDRLETSRSGLTEREAVARQQRFGRNRLPRPPRTVWWRALVRQFTHLFAVLLWIAAGLSWWLGMIPLSVAIVAVILINGVFSYWQQFRAEQAVSALESLLPRQATVRRQNREVVISATDVTIGDVLLLREGDAIPADARILFAERLRIDTAALTGESRPVDRTAAPVAAEQTQAIHLSNLLFAGTFVTAGRAEAGVFATGQQTEFGRLASLTHAQPNRPSPLEQEMLRITRMITVMAVTMGVVFFAIGWGMGRLTPAEGFVFALGLIVANVPEGLLPTLSLSLAISVRRMAAKQAVVKRLERVETLGAVTTIVTDKTGTLTCNQMTVRELWAAGREYQVSGTGYDPDGAITLAQGGPANLSEIQLLLTIAALCCDARLIPPSPNLQSWSIQGDPTEGALLAAARKAGIAEPALAAQPRLAELPFDSLRKRMATLQQSNSGVLVCVKGALEPILGRCVSMHGEGTVVDLPLVRDEILSVARRLAEQGRRVLAVAMRTLDQTPDLSTNLDPVENELVFLGLIAMEDPPRAEVPQALARCHQAGIRVIMATGDDGRTASAISREIGLSLQAPHVVTGEQLDRLNDRALALLLGRQGILFARVTPAHKLRLVEALQARGEVVAVTGDGVNDAPALRRADIGVAMGRNGTDVAREAADIILLDDNFSTIVAAVEEGRSVYDNIRKFMTYILASNVPEIVPFIVFVLFRIPLPLTVMQVLAVDLGTDLFPALALGSEPPEPDIMQRPPRNRSRPLLNRALLARSYLWLGGIQSALGLAGFFWIYWRSGWQGETALPATGDIYRTATTMSLAAIVACQLGNALACRSDHRSLNSIGWFSNPSLWFAMGLEVAILLLLMHLDPLSSAFALEPLSRVDWLLLAGFGPALLAAEEARKWIVRKGYAEKQTASQSLTTSDSV